MMISLFRHLMKARLCLDMIMTNTDYNCKGPIQYCKQPVFIGFYKKVQMLQSSKTSTILYLHVYDCRGSNIVLYKELEISVDKSYVLYSITEQKIFFMLMSPQLLELFRNRFTDRGFCIQNCKLVTKEP